MAPAPTGSLPFESRQAARMPLVKRHTTEAKGLVSHSRILARYPAPHRVLLSTVRNSVRTSKVTGTGEAAGTRER